MRRLIISRNKRWDFAIKVEHLQMFYFLPPYRMAGGLIVGAIKKNCKQNEVLLAGKKGADACGYEKVDNIRKWENKEQRSGLIK